MTKPKATDPTNRQRAKQKQATYSRGLQAERWAGWIMRAKGYTILERRYKARGGEIDLIGQKDRDIIFVEVKFRKHLEEALHAITPRNQARIIAAAEHYIATQSEGHTDQADGGSIDGYRFDVIAFGQSVNGKPQYSHLENAFGLF